MSENNKFDLVNNGLEFLSSEWKENLTNSLKRITTSNEELSEEESLSVIQNLIDMDYSLKSLKELSEDKVIPSDIPDNAYELAKLLSASAKTDTCLKEILCNSAKAIAEYLDSIHYVHLIDRPEPTQLTISDRVRQEELRQTDVMLKDVANRIGIELRDKKEPTSNKSINELRKEEETKLNDKLDSLARILIIEKNYRAWKKGKC